MKDTDIIRYISYDENLGILELNKKYGNILRQSARNVFDNNIDLIEISIDKFYKGVKRNFLYRGDVSLITYFNAQFRKELLALLRERNDISYFLNISDIAVMYSKECNAFSNETFYSEKFDSSLSHLNKKETEFFIRRYYYLHDKKKVMSEMNLNEERFEKLQTKIEASFGSNTIKLINMASNIDLQYLEIYNKKVYPNYICNNSDIILHVPTEQELRSQRINKRLLFWSVFTAIIFLTIVIFRLIFKH